MCKKTTQKRNRIVKLCSLSIESVYHFIYIDSSRCRSPESFPFAIETFFTLHRIEYMPAYDIQYSNRIFFSIILLYTITECTLIY